MVIVSLATALGGGSRNFANTQLCPQRRNLASHPPHAPRRASSEMALDSSLFPDFPCVSCRFIPSDHAAGDGGLSVVAEGEDSEVTRATRPTQTLLLMTAPPNPSEAYVSREENGESNPSSPLEPLRVKRRRAGALAGAGRCPQLSKPLPPSLYPAGP